MSKDLTYYGESKAIEDATKQWVETFNNVPQSILDDLVEAKGTIWEEVCVPLFHISCKIIEKEGNCRHINHLEDMEDKSNTILRDRHLLEDPCDIYLGCSDESDCHAQCDASDNKFYEDIYPMWSTLFQPDPWDRDWFRDNAQEIYEKIGLLVYENEHYDILIGVNSAGHDFYAAYWTKLYKMRGLMWHE